MYVHFWCSVVTLVTFGRINNKFELIKKIQLKNQEGEKNHKRPENLKISIYTCLIFNRPGVAGAVL